MPISFLFWCELPFLIIFQAFSSLGEAAYENASSSEEEEPLSYILSGKFKFIVEKLIATAERFDAQLQN